jgi:flavin-binding protein dodecin
MVPPIGTAITRANNQIARFTRFYATVNTQQRLALQSSRIEPWRQSLEVGFRAF